jgi:hypothetical protein
MSKIFFRLISILVVIAVLIGILIQFIPYGRNHQNPPVVQEPKWANPETRALAKRACFDCHSNETVWPWYSNIAPVSWLVYRDVEEGRANMNFSEWKVAIEPGEIAEVVDTGRMPLPQYLLLHPTAKFSDQEVRTFIDGVNKTFGQ